MPSFLSKRSNTLIEGIFTHNIPGHAWLFHGSKSAFLRQVSLYTALRLNNTDLPDDDRLFSSPLAYCEDHVDLDYFPKTGPLTIECVRGIQERIKYGPHSCSYLVVIVEDCDKMSPQVANAFLKCLEEPPARVLFLLTSYQYHAVLPTIRSRSKSLYIDSAPDLFIDSMIQSKVENPDLRSIFSSYKGCFHYFLTQPEIFDTPLSSLSFSYIASLSTPKKLILAESLFKERDLLPFLFSVWMHQILDSKTPIPVTSTSALELIIETLTKMRYNLNLRLQLETFLLQVVPA